MSKVNLSLKIKKKKKIAKYNLAVTNISSSSQEISPAKDIVKQSSRVRQSRPKYKR